MLTPLVVVVMDELLNSTGQFLVGIKVIEIVHLTLQNTPESLHRAIINAAANSRHTLFHSLFIQFSLELLARVLESAVTMEQWVCVRIFLYCQIKGNQ